MNFQEKGENQGKGKEKIVKSYVRDQVYYI